MAHDVFVSYPSKEKPTADAAVTALETAGTRCWIAPRDIPPGADWAGSIVDAIEHSRLMVLVFSDATNESSHILREVREAADANIPILPFRITPTEPSAALQYYVGGTHWLDALTPDLDGHLTDLAAQVGDLLTDRPAEPRPTPARTPVPAPAPRSNTALMVVGTLVAIAILLLAGTWLFAPGTDTAPTTAPLAADDTEAPAPTPAPTPTLSPSTTRTQTTIVVEDTSAAPTGYLGFQPSILAIANEFGPSRICVLGGEEASCVDITPTDTTFTDVAIADLNADEFPDVVFAAVGGMVDPITRQGSVGSGAHNTLCLATGAGGWDCSEMADSLAPSGDIDAADMDLDGDIDLVIGNWQAFSDDSRTRAEICLNDGSATFTCAPLPDNDLGDLGGGGPAGLNDITVGDLNGDGTPDVVLSEWLPASEACLGAGDGTFSCAPLPINSDVGFMGAAIGDVDGDGIADIAVADNDTPSHLCRGIGGGAFACSPFAEEAAGAFAATIFDLNADGVDDVSLLMENGNGINGCLGPITDPGACEWIALDPEYSLGGVGYGMLIDDFDNDGAVDLIYTWVNRLVACLDGLNRSFSCQQLPAELVSQEVPADGGSGPEPRAIAWTPMP